MYEKGLHVFVLKIEDLWVTTTRITEELAQLNQGH
jgi:hypothetical protein